MLTPEQLAHLRSDIEFSATLHGYSFSFRSTWGLFSPRAIDEGTRLLAEALVVNEHDDCLDLGCGYGPLGLVLAALAPKGQTLMVDKDFVAVEFSNKNARLNRLDNARALLSNGFDQIPPKLRFDIIASNIPAKVGKELLSLYLHDARNRLKPGGRLYLVTVSGLRQFMKRNLEEVLGNYDKLKQGHAYTVALAVKHRGSPPLTAYRAPPADDLPPDPPRLSDPAPSP
jgi:16S rRNA G1207 methylase RsmC